MMSLPPEQPRGYDSAAAPSALKKSLRKLLLKDRRSLPAEVKARYDREISRLALAHLKSLPFKTIGIYLPIRNEPDLSVLYDALSREMEMSLPVTTPDSPLDFFYWQPGMPLKEDAYHTLVPEKRFAVKMPEVLLIPCVGFSSAKYRLGYGGGFFDRTLEKYPETHTIGIAYSFLEAEFAAEENDVPLHCIITETGIVV